jgi:hypothetical protein
MSEARCVVGFQNRSMSAWGHKRPIEIPPRSRDVRFAPIADVGEMMRGAPLVCLACRVQFSCIVPVLHK